VEWVKHVPSFSAHKYTPKTRSFIWHRGGSDGGGECGSGGKVFIQQTETFSDED
jgi:hypothetical protein